MNDLFTNSGPGAAATTPRPESNGKPDTGKANTKTTVSEIEYPHAGMSLFASGFSKEPVERIDLAELVRDIRDGKWRNQVDQLRAMLDAGDKAGYDEGKRTLPAVSLSGEITGPRKAAPDEGRFKHSGFLQADFDAKDHPDLDVDGMLEILRDDPHVEAAFRSPSNLGAKAVIRIEPDLEKHRDSFRAAKIHFAAKGLTIDESTKDPNRLCFVSYDTEVALRKYGDDALVLPPSAPEPKPAPRQEPRPAKAPEPFQHREEDKEATIRMLLSCIKERPGYDEWLAICSAVWNEVGEAGTGLLHEWRPEERAGEYSAKFPDRLSDKRMGTLVNLAKQHGYVPERRREQNHQTSKEGLHFSPVGIFYDATCGKYLVDIGNHYRAYSRKSPVAEGLRRFFSSEGLHADEAKDEAAASLRSIEIDHAVDWSGCIAGFKRGMHRKEGMSLLVTAEAELVDPVAGDCPVINGLIRDAFPNLTERIVFIGWLSGAVKAVRSGLHSPSPMLVLAGAVNTGKSLLSWIVSVILGGRVGHPFTAWSGTLPWNDDIIGAELLLIDDSVSSTDIRTRREFGARFKEAIYSESVQLRKRNVSAISLRPVWRVMVCCNDTPEALAIIPPIDEDLDDKVTLLRVHGITPPVDTSSAEGKRELQRMVRAELPAFMAVLLDFVVPPDMKDSRSGMKAWRDPGLEDAIDGLTRMALSLGFPIP